MKLSKVRNSVRLPKAGIFLIFLIFLSAQLNAQIITNYPPNLPNGIPGRVNPTGTGLPPTTTQNTNAGDARQINITDDEADVMTIEDSIYAATQEQELEDLKLQEYRRKIFGYKLFNGVSYDPNSVLNIPTPNNYVLGSQDELIIDIYGYSQGNFETTISPDGYITIPRAGLVEVAGLEIEEATQRIKKALSKVYFGLTQGNTFVKVSLGDIRSIKVNIVGEVIAPGTYTMSSLNTVLNALYKCGGPNEVGSFRKIDVVRGNKTIATVDLYDVLVKGYSDQNILLKDQDVIRVPVFEKRIIFSGEVKRNGYFEALNQESLKDLIEYAGGFTPNAYQHRLKVYRNTFREKEIKEVLNANLSDFQLSTGDSIYVSPVLDRFTNLVSI